MDVGEANAAQSILFKVLAGIVKTGMRVLVYVYIRSSISFVRFPTHTAHTRQQHPKQPDSSKRALMSDEPLSNDTTQGAGPSIWQAIEPSSSSLPDSQPTGRCGHGKIPYCYLGLDFDFLTFEMYGLRTA